MLDAILKRTRPSSRDAILVESYMKESTRLYAMSSHQAQSLTSKSTTVKQLTPRYVPFIQANEAKSHESQGKHDIQHRAGEIQLAMLECNFTKVHTITGHTSIHNSARSINHHPLCSLHKRSFRTHLLKTNKSD